MKYLLPPPTPPLSTSPLHLKWSQVRSPKVKSCGQSLDKRLSDIKPLKSTEWTKTFDYLSPLSCEAWYRLVYRCN